MTDASPNPALLEGIRTVGTTLCTRFEDDIPEIAQARRLGHRLSGVRGIYSHVTPSMIQATIRALQDRWQANQPSKPRHLKAA